MNLLECKPNTQRLPVPTNYFDMLNVNKTKFKQDTTEGNEIPAKVGGKSNTTFIERLLKDRLIKDFKKFTDSDEEFIENVRMMLASGVLAKKTIQLIKKDIEKLAATENTIDPMKVLYILRKHIKQAEITQPDKTITYLKREVILSEYLLK